MSWKQLKYLKTAEARRYDFRKNSASQQKKYFYHSYPLQKLNNSYYI